MKMKVLNVNAIELQTQIVFAIDSPNGQITLEEAMQAVEASLKAQGYGRDEVRKMMRNTRRKYGL